MARRSTKVGGGAHKLSAAAATRRSRRTALVCRHCCQGIYIATVFLILRDSRLVTAFARKAGLKVWNLLLHGTVATHGNLSLRLTIENNKIKDLTALPWADT